MSVQRASPTRPGRPLLVPMEAKDKAEVSSHPAFGSDIISREAHLSELEVAKAEARREAEQELAALR